MKNTVLPALLVLSLATLGSRPSLAEPVGAAGLPGTPGLWEAASALEGSAARAILGKWKKVGEAGVVEVSESAGVFTGKLIKSEKMEDLIGEALFRNLKFNANKGLYEGKIYVPKRKKEYDATYTVVGNKLTMKVKGRVIEWSRV